jgi:hypothetical protein
MLGTGAMLGAITEPVPDPHVVHVPGGLMLNPSPPTANASVEAIVNESRAELPRPGRMPGPKQIGAGMWKSLRHCVGIWFTILPMIGASS